MSISGVGNRAFGTNFERSDEVSGLQQGEA